jgi:ATP-dependent protease ClpP protease subunit
MNTPKALQSVVRLGRRVIPAPTFDPERMIEYLGLVNYDTCERIIEEMHDLVLDDPAKEIVMLVTCAGGPSGTAMGFYDTIRSVIKPKLVTIGSGDVDSSGVLVFLTGSKRYVTKNTTVLLHQAGGCFEGGQRYTAADIDAILREYRLKDFQYASILAEHSHGKLSSKKVLDMMEKNTILTPLELVNYGLADAII